MDAPEDYAVRLAVPSVADHMRLRAAAGLSGYDAATTAAGLANTIVGVVVDHDGRTIGMGRVVGDGGLAYLVVDIAVEPANQGRGLGKRIMQALMDALARSIPGRTYVSLIADGEAHRLYAQYGFASVAPTSIGMAQWLDPA